MSVQRTAVVHTSVQASTTRLVDYLSDMQKWKTWAPWVRSVERSSARDWKVVTDDGIMTFHFVEPNELGVLDHQVTLPSGVTVLNSMRVVSNGTGSELVMLLFQSPVTSNEEFQRDIQAVTADLARIKKAIEAA